MAPAVSRKLSITYGAFTVGGSTDYSLDGNYSVSKGYESSYAEFSFVISKDTTANFNTACSTAEAAFRQVRKDFTITIDSVVFVALKQSDYSGFDSSAEILKKEDLKVNTGRSRKYYVRITFGMPADASDAAACRARFVNVAEQPSGKRTITISGVMTAISGTDARTKYNATIGTICGAILTAIGGVYELVEVPTAQTNLASTLLEFNRVYEEVIYDEPGGSPDTAAIVRQTFVISRRRAAPGDTQDKVTRRLIQLSTRYDCWIDKNISTNLKSLWESSIRAFAITKIKDAVDSKMVAVVEEIPEFDGPQNRISARIECLAIPTDAFCLESELSYNDTRSPGYTIQPVWDKSRNPYCAYPYPGPAQLTRQISERKRYPLGKAPSRAFQNPPNLDFFPQPTPHGGFSVDDYTVVSDNEKRTELEIGLGSDTFEVVDISRDSTVTYYKLPTSGRQAFTYSTNVRPPKWD